MRIEIGSSPEWQGSNAAVIRERSFGVGIDEVE
jgi:hypothetical protein